MSQRTSHQERIYNAAIEFVSALALVSPAVADDLVESAKSVAARVMFAADQIATYDQRFAVLADQYAADQAAYERADDTVPIEMDDTVVIKSDVRTDDTVVIKTDETVAVKPNVWTGEPNALPPKPPPARTYDVDMPSLAALIARLR